MIRHTIIAILLAVASIACGCGGGGGSGAGLNLVMCVPHVSKVCGGDDVYWRDSCGIVEDMYQECGNGESCIAAGCVPASWSATFGWDERERAFSAIQTPDGGFIAGGTSLSVGPGLFDMYIVKLDPAGVVEWSKLMGGPSDEAVNSIENTSDGGFIIAGHTYSYGAGGRDYLVVKTDEAGDQEWAMALGGMEYDWARSAKQTPDGGFIVGGVSRSYGAGGYDFWVIKLDPEGEIIWDELFGGPATDWFDSIELTDDGGFLAAGYTESYGAGEKDAWIVKMNSSGGEQWAKTFGGEGHDGASSAVRIPDGGYIFAGCTNSSGAGDYDAWVVRLDSSGNQMWAKTYGGSDNDRAIDIRSASEGGYIIAGYTESYGAGGRDFWVLKISESGTEEWSHTYGGASDDRAYSIREVSDGRYLVAGITESYGGGMQDMMIIKIEPDGTCEDCYSSGRIAPRTPEGSDFGIIKELSAVREWRRPE